MINIKSIDHICLWVSSLTTSKEYYEKLFNIKCATRQGDAKTLVVESDFIHFFISEHEEKSGSAFLKKQHLSFSVEQLDDVVRYLEELNIEYVLGDVDFFKNRNYKWCEWRDPDGIRLECIEIQ